MSLSGQAGGVSGQAGGGFAPISPLFRRQTRPDWTAGESRDESLETLLLKTGLYEAAWSKLRTVWADLG